MGETTEKDECDDHEELKVLIDIRDGKGDVDEQKDDRPVFHPTNEFLFPISSLYREPLIRLFVFHSISLQCTADSSVLLPRFAAAIVTYILLFFSIIVNTQDLKLSNQTWA